PRPPRLPRYQFGNELRPDAKQCGIASIAQCRCEVGRQAHGAECVERAGDPARGRQNRVGARDVTAWREVGHCGAGKRGGAEHIGGRGRRGIDLYDVERAGLEREIAGDGHRGGRSPLAGNAPLAGNEEAASVDLGRCHAAVAHQCSTEKAAPPHGDKLWRPQNLSVDEATSVTVRLPMPGPPPPIWRPLLMMNNCEPGPVTVTSPLPKAVPTLTPPKVVSVLPFVMVRLPTPSWPTTRDCAVAPGAVTTVGFLVVSMVALVTFVGTPAVQFAAVNQSEDISPVQLVWARVERQHRSGCQKMCTHRRPPANAFALRASVV